MAKRQVVFTFPQKLIKEPIIYDLGIKFKIITNVRRADITESKGWVVLVLEGEESNIDKGLEWVASTGVRVDPVVGNIVEA
jgi:hypothetical protein